MATAKKSLDKKVTKTPEQKKMEEMEKELNELKKLIQSNSKNQEISRQVLTEDSIPFNKQIKVMSLCPNELNLSTSRDSSAHHYKFEYFGEVRRIFYGDVLGILNNHRNFKEIPLFMVLDDRICEEENLTDIYNKTLSKEKIEMVLSNKEGAMELFQLTNPKQQNIIVKMIVASLIEGKSVDQNLINSIDRFMNPNNDRNFVTINDKVENAKEANATRLQENR